jgi:hypothetical protein
MTEVVKYQGEVGLMAVLQALEGVRHLLASSRIEPQQAAAYLGCINMHLARLTGARGDFLQDLQECGGLLCPNCKGWVGFVSDLSGNCHLCGAKLFPATG